MEDSVSTPMEVVPPQEANSVDNATEESTKLKTNSESNESKNKINRRKRAFFKNQMKARVTYLRKKYLMRTNKTLTSQQKGQQPLKPADSKGATQQPRRRRIFVKNVHLQKNGIDISFDMSESEQKMLEVYVLKLSVLKSENESLHTQLGRLAKENMRLLQSTPVPTPV